MIVTTRRRILGGTSLLALAAVGLMAGCSSSAATTPAQIVADAAGLVSALQSDLPLIVAADPNLMDAQTEAAVQMDLAKAQALAAQVTPQMTATQGATTLKTVEAYINVALEAASAVATAGAGSPLAAYALPIQAAIVLAGVIEAWINATLGAGTTTASARAKAVAPGMTPEKARVILGVKTVA
jgi:hypothetical protein